jgi:hypothetical protein
MNKFKNMYVYTPKTYKDKRKCKLALLILKPQNAKMW